ncbi:MAG: hypothetical protein AB7F98_04335 [Novosphingobium sp.]
MMTILIEVAGWIAAVLILASYMLVSSNRLSGQSSLFQWMNVVGSALFVANTAWHGAMPSAALNAVWCAVGLYTLWRLHRLAAA